jgi:hypothetical protein
MHERVLDMPDNISFLPISCIDLGSAVNAVGLAA